MNVPTVSVVMATYNHADFVVQAIESVLGQRGVALEFLIADDGSVDATRDVVAAVSDRRIRFFPHERNRGACTVTNELVSRARGEFIALINSDDRWCADDKLACQLAILRDDPVLAATFGRARFIDRYGAAIEKAALPFGSVFDQENRSPGHWLRRFFELGNCLCHPTMLIRRACYDEIGLYNNRLRQLPDFDQWIRLVKRHPIHVSERELVDFRILPGENASGQTSTNSIRTINEHFLIAERFFAGVDRERLREGFDDLLVNDALPTEAHLGIEKALLYFVPNQWLGKPYQLIGLLQLGQLLGCPQHRQVLADEYGIDDRWFHRTMGEVDVLRPRMLAAMSEQKAQLRSLWQRVAGGMRRVAVR